MLYASIHQLYLWHPSNSTIYTIKILLITWWMYVIFLGCIFINVIMPLYSKKFICCTSQIAINIDFMFHYVGPSDIHGLACVIIVVAYRLESDRFLLRNMCVWFWHKLLGAVSIRKTVLPGMAIPMLKIRRPNGRLIFNMEIAIRR